MAKYAQLADIPDESVMVLESDLLEADNYIENLLTSNGIAPPTGTNDTLRVLAVYYALYRACVREARGEDTVYLDKAKQYEKLYKEKSVQVVRVLRRSRLYGFTVRRG